jgi:hypothetical protein
LSLLKLNESAGQYGDNLRAGIGGSEKIGNHAQRW